MPSDAPEPVEEVEIGLRQEAVHRALGSLSEQEQAVIKLRYGINGDDPTPLREAGRRLGLSPERVRRIEHKALERLATRARWRGCQRPRDAEVHRAPQAG